MHERRGPWTRLLHRTAGVHPRSIPSTFPLFSTADIKRSIPAPGPWLAAVREAGLVLPIARGVHLAAPERSPDGWTPDPVEVAWLLAVRHFGWVVPYVSAMSAAAEHGACPRVPGVVHVTVPRQMRAARLVGIATSVVFHQRREVHQGSPLWGFWAPDRGATGPMLASRPGTLCDPILTTRIQTALDLFHSPRRSGHPEAAEEVARRLVQEVPPADIDAVARGQRRHSAAERLGYLRTPLPPAPASRWNV